VIRTCFGIGWIYQKERRILKTNDHKI